MMAGWWSLILARASKPSLARIPRSRLLQEISALRRMVFESSITITRVPLIGLKSCVAMPRLRASERCSTCRGNGCGLRAVAAARPGRPAQSRPSRSPPYGRRTPAGPVRGSAPRRARRDAVVRQPGGFVVDQPQINNPCALARISCHFRSCSSRVRVDSHTCRAIIARVSAGATGENFNAYGLEPISWFGPVAQCRGGRPRCPGARFRTAMAATTRRATRAHPLRHAAGALPRLRKLAPFAASVTTWTARTALCPRPADHPRRRQLAGARLPLGRRYAAVHRAGAGGAFLDATVDATSTTSAPGADDRRPRAPRRGRRRAGGRARGLSYGAPTEPMSRWPRNWCAWCRRWSRSGGLLRHRGGDERHPPGRGAAGGGKGDGNSSSSRAATTATPTAAGEGRLGTADLRQPELGRVVPAEITQHTLVLDTTTASSSRTRSRRTATTSPA